jgi:hypothetical protein
VAQELERLASAVVAVVENYRLVHSFVLVLLQEDGEINSVEVIEIRN